MKHLVIGLGEVGSAIQQILQCDGYDNSKAGSMEIGQKYDILHICFTYGSDFVKHVIDYQVKYKPKYIVVHSTVPIGTCRAHGWTHSPIRGKHPDLKESILTFTKYIGGVNALAVGRELQKFGINIKVVTDADNTEAGKLYDLMQYAVSILLSKHIYKACKEKGLNFDTVYRDFNKTYNIGYQQMGMPEVNRPILEYKPGPIGGHCVVPMMSLLDDLLAKDIINANKNL